MIFNRPNLVFAHDVFMAAIAILVSIMLRLGTNIEFYPKDDLYISVGIFTIVAAVVFRLMNMYKGVWRYASINDLITITKSVSLAVLILIIILFTFTRLEQIPRSLPFILWFVLIFFLGAPRFLYRLVKDGRFDFQIDRNRHLRIPILLVGAGDNAELFIRDVLRSDSNYEVLGIISETRNRVGRDIHDIEVLGTFDEIPNIIAKLSKMASKPQRLVITVERPDPSVVRKLLTFANDFGMTLARLPSLSEFQESTSESITIRPINVEDLLGRPQKLLDKSSVNRLVSGKRILISGAGGSIGSELVNQLATFSPAHLSLLDNSEYNLFSVDLELSEGFPNLSRSALLADVRDKKRLKSVIKEERPNIIFHAAALKHVPMVEANINEGIATNVIGTRNIADVAVELGVETFIQISTDKAVNPSSIMGASKRMAEQYCQALNIAQTQASQLNFITVRFGNVLGSTGSVVEIFQNQIQRGGPISVTHPDMTRYFMTINEAVELVLQASALGREVEELGGRILVLDMGEPVKIVDLAKQMVRLAGLKPEKDIKINFTGLRPGEKLFEELLHDSESSIQSAQEGVLVAATRIVDLKEINENLNKIEVALEKNNIKELNDIIRLCVPEYKPG
jgi:FlaA1/EpsC-like NDP-sugar epimerase